MLAALAVAGLVGLCAAVLARLVPAAAVGSPTTRVAPPHLAQIQPKPRETSRNRQKSYMYLLFPLDEV